MTDIPLSAHVKCTDGACGKATHVVLNPVTRQVTHFALEDKKLPNNPTRLVPISKVTGTTSSEIRLNCSINDVARMPAFIVENFIETPVTGDAWDMGSAYLHPHTFNEKPLDTYEEENIPAQEIAVASGMEIEAIDGKLGKLDNLVLDPNTGAISHLLMREGHLWGKKLITIPISAVSSTRGDVIYLKLDQKAVAELPIVPLKNN